MKKLKYILLIFICLFGITICNASTNTYERTEDNLRVNKKWDIDSSNINHVLNTPSVDATEKVYDFADILTDAEEYELKIMIDKFIDHTGFDMVFVSDSFYYSNNSDNENYAADFYDYNDFGIDNDLYSGIILFRNANNSDPYYGVYFFGNAQLYYSQEREDDILDKIYFDFKGQNYINGLKTFFSETTYYYDEGIPREMKNYYVDDMGYLRKHYAPPIAIGIFISGIITTVVLIILVNKNKMIAQETKAYEYLDVNSINYSVRQDNFITSHTSSYVVSSSSSSGGGGGGSHSGSSGGGHSGGGRHG